MWKHVKIKVAGPTLVSFSREKWGTSRGGHNVGNYHCRSFEDRFLHRLDWLNEWVQGVATTLGLLPDTQNCGMSMRRECREHFRRYRLQRKLLVSDPDMHHGTCVRHARAVMHVGITNPRWLGKRSRHSRRMRNPQFYASGKRPMTVMVTYFIVKNQILKMHEIIDKVLHISSDFCHERLWNGKLTNMNYRSYRDDWMNSHVNATNLGFEGLAIVER